MGTKIVCIGVCVFVQMRLCIYVYVNSNGMNPSADLVFKGASII